MCFICLFFFFKQKTAYEMRISDWSSDVCSSDLQPLDVGLGGHAIEAADQRRHPCEEAPAGKSGAIGQRPDKDVTEQQHCRRVALAARPQIDDGRQRDRKSVEKGKRVSVRLELGGRGFFKEKKKKKKRETR